MDFSNAGLAAAAGYDPWARLRQFDAGDPSEIWDLAAAFRSAAGEQQVAMEQATLGFQYVEAGYRVDDSTPLDVAGELADARVALGDDGTKLYEVAKILEAVAEDLSSRTSSARDEVRLLETALAAKRAAYNSCTNVPTGSGMTDADGSELNALHNEAVDLVEIAGQHVTTSVEAYDDFLYVCVSRMAGFGYVPGDDLDQGPGDVTFTAAGAATDAASVTDGLASQPPSAGGAGQIAEGTEAITVLEAKLAAGAALTLAEKAYIDAWFAGVGEEGLAALPAYAAAVSALPAGIDGPVQDPTWTTALVTPISNLIMRLSETNVDGQGLDDVPVEVTNLSNTEVGWVDPETGLRYMHEGSGNRTGPVDGAVAVSGLDQWNGFANLMSTAAAAGSSGFVTDLGDDALRVKRQQDEIAANDASYTTYAFDEYGSSTETPDEGVLTVLHDDSGVNAILDIVAGDVEASQNLLDPTCKEIGEPSNLETLLTANWADPGHAIDIINTATNREQDTPALAEGAAQAASNVMNLIGQDPEGWRERVPKGSEMSNAITEIGAEWVHALGMPDAQSPLSAAQTADGSFVSMFGLDPQRGIDFVQFVSQGSGGYQEGVNDPDMAKLYLAADLYNRAELAKVLVGDQADPVQNALKMMATIDATLSMGDLHAAEIENDNAQDAAKEALQNQMFGHQLIERVISNTIGQVPAVGDFIGGLLKDGIDALYDEYSSEISAESLAQLELEGETAEDMLYNAMMADNPGKTALNILAAKQLAGIPLGVPPLGVGMDGPLATSGEMPTLEDLAGTDLNSLVDWANDPMSGHIYHDGHDVPSLKLMLLEAHAVWQDAMRHGGK